MRPDSQHLPNWCSFCAEKSEIQATWRTKNNRSPFSAHVHQRMPCLYSGLCFERVTVFSDLIHIAIKYFQEGNVREHLDCHSAYIPPVSSSPRLLRKRHTYIGVPWRIPPQSHEMHMFPSMAPSNDSLSPSMTLGGKKMMGGRWRGMPRRPDDRVALG